MISVVKESAVWPCISTWIEAHPSLAAWVQAVGTILALALAIIIPWRQYAAEAKNRTQEAAEQRRSTRQHLTSALLVEVKTLDEVLASRWEVSANILRQAVAASAQGRPVDLGKISDATERITDAVIYRAATRDLGILPANLIELIVKYYTFLSQIEQTAGMSTSFAGTLEVHVGMIPRARMTGEMLRIGLERFAAANFPDELNIRLTNPEILAAATRTAYPLDDIAKGFGIDIDQLKAREAEGRC